jgi:outer membrane protein OmpA-like peptidoglycan-associated protein
MIILSSTLLYCVGTASAEETQFPTTADEIVKALEKKAGRTTRQGTQYISKGGAIFRVIDEKRIQVRGVDEIVDSGLAPKAAAMIYFDFNSARIRAESHSLLDEWGKALNRRELADAVLQVGGHTDSKGSSAYNDELSLRRAHAVAGYLRKWHEIDTYRLTVKAYGENRPLDSNANEQGRAKNRRVEFVRVQ